MRKSRRVLLNLMMYSFQRKMSRILKIKKQEPFFCEIFTLFLFIGVFFCCDFGVNGLVRKASNGPLSEYHNNFINESYLFTQISTIVKAYMINGARAVYICPIKKNHPPFLLDNNLYWNPLAYGLRLANWWAR